MPEKNLQWKLTAKDDASKATERVRKEQERLNDSLAKGKKETDRMAATNAKAEGSFASIGKALAAVGGALVLLRKAQESVNLAAQFEQLSGSFDVLTARMGMSGDALLAKLEQVSAGTVSRNNLILASNRAMALGVGKDMETMTTLMEIARVKGRALGLDTTQAFSDIVTGIGRGSPLILDNLGITIKLEEAQQKYAKSLGKSADALTDTEKKNALLFAVLESGKKELAEVGDLTVTAAERMQQYQTKIENLKVAVGQALLPAVMTGMGILEKLGSGVATAFDIAGQAIDRTGATTETFGDKASKFLDSFTSAMKAGLIAVGIGVNVIIKGLQMAALGAMGAMGRVWNGMLKAIDWSIRGVKNAINEVINVYNKAMVAIGQLDKVASPVQVGGKESLLDKYGIDESTFSEIGDAISWSFEDMVQGVTAGADKMFSALDEKMPKIEKAVTKAGTGMATGMGDAVEEVSDKTKKAQEKISEAMDKLADDYNGATDKAAEALAKLDRDHSNTVRSIQGKISDLMRSLADLRDAYAETTSDLNRQEAERVVSEQQAIEEMEKAIQQRLESGKELSMQDVEDIQKQRDALAERKRAFQEYQAARGGALSTEVAEAQRRSGLTDFQRAVEDINAKRAEEAAAHSKKVAEINDEIAVQKAALAEEEAIYLAKRHQYLETQAALSAFHDDLVDKMKSMEAQTEESVNAMNNKLRQMQDILAQIESVRNQAGLQASLIKSGGSSAYGGGSSTTSNVQNVTIDMSKVNVKSPADVQALAQEIARQIQLANMGAS